MRGFFSAGVARLLAPFVQARIPLAGAPLIRKSPAIGTGAILSGRRPVSLAAASRVVAVHRVTVRPVIASAVIARRVMV